MPLFPFRFLIVTLSQASLAFSQSAFVADSMDPCLRAGLFIRRCGATGHQDYPQRGYSVDPVSSEWTGRAQKEWNERYLKRTCLKDGCNIAATTGILRIPKLQLCCW
jgi:hypothetical protein